MRFGFEFGGGEGGLVVFGGWRWGDVEEWVVGWVVVDFLVC